ncbi:hypothetical protein H8M03_05630 [Sphingomonas sabuli]|uniref:SGNH/GDSL hydrolase family protein n=1 Tax=Sphingomonas sabuli TaxID=2764186 RepID=A0A7G9L5A2_9SPHN|nr:hypothetical protein [Sphingomonas sabuli]QNM83801.1 hypothetical protein H8M03_05630 [Sphingomonas sabuli]
MPSNDPFYILGDSHVTAFLMGVRKADGKQLLRGGGWGNGKRFFDQFFEIEDNGRIEIFADRTHYRKWVQQAGRDLNDCQGRVIVSMGTSATSLFNSPMWQIFGPGRTPISQDLFDTILDDMLVHVLDFYRALKERGLIAAAYMAPPPQRTHPAFRRLGEKFVWDLIRQYQAPVLALLKEENIPLIELPVADADGYLLPKYAGPDEAHANPWIGEHAVKALRELAEELAVPA